MELLKVTGGHNQDAANSEEDLHFCIMEHSQDAVMDDTTNRVAATAAVKLGDQHEWEKWSLQELSEEAETRSLYSSVQQVPDAWYIGI